MNSDASERQFNATIKSMEQLEEQCMLMKGNTKVYKHNKLN